MLIDFTGRGHADDYRRWIGFYSDLIRTLSRSERNLLVDADLASRDDGGERNTLLRVLDKAFFVEAAPGQPCF